MSSDLRTSWDLKKKKSDFPEDFYVFIYLLSTLMFLTGNVEVAARKCNSDELDYYSLPLPQFSDFTLPEVQNEEYENEARQNYILP